MSRLYGSAPTTNQISLVQVLSVVAIILVAFVLPAQLVTLSQIQSNRSEYSLSRVAEKRQVTTSSQASNTGQVAGATTARGSTIAIPGTNIVINLGNSGTSILVIGGVLLLAVAMSLTLYLLVTK